MIDEALGDPLEEDKVYAERYRWLRQNWLRVRVRIVAGV